MASLKIAYSPNINVPEALLEQFSYCPLSPDVSETGGILPHEEEKELFLTYKDLGIPLFLKLSTGDYGSTRASKSIPTREFTFSLELNGDKEFSITKKALYLIPKEHIAVAIEEALQDYESKLFPPFYKTLKDYSQRGNLQFDCPGH